MLLGAGMMLPDFEGALVGIAEGQTRTFEVAFPADYHAKDLAGNTVQFEASCKKVEAPRLPELDADFADTRLHPLVADEQQGVRIAPVDVDHVAFQPRQRVA